MIQLSTQSLAVLSCTRVFSAIVVLITALFIMCRRGRNGVAILSLVLIAGVVSESMLSALTGSLLQEIGLSRPYGIAAYAAAAVIVYIFFSRSTVADKSFTALFLLSSVLLAVSGIFNGMYSPGAAAVGILVGIASSGLVYTAVVSMVKYYFSIGR
ncbi:hypothetical protein OO006_14005 [Prosthecochloris sp. SCSIO W1101]|uniref:hypothetical protein n=1 Tax=Prosthecochloris sp. SCSIO W1101 TaxID=2992242 RepID=UPI00223E2BC3|nr:hypothetical protein [Prosthecochloris sp. SCSIO W1101]UZJ41432.1 hypothetical protein OO006_14005 [Prosthecochloris sp. SCSIO W1101]